MTIDWTLLWQMNGHGPYVWAAYGVAMLLLAAEAASLWRRRKALRTAGQRAQDGRRP